MARRSTSAGRGATRAGEAQRRSAARRPRTPAASTPGAVPQPGGAPGNTVEALVQAAEALRAAVRDYPERAPLGAAHYVLNPLEYAWGLHRDYLTRYGPSGAGRVEAVLVGMNPGPWGMAQTGVPFGSPDVVREFLALTGDVVAPARTHPKRPIHGLGGARTEVSGQRLWGGVRDCFRAPAPFFARFFVLNYCPLVFQSETGANLTPDKLPADLMAPCLEACDEHMAAALSALRPTTVVAIGKWAEKQLQRLARARGLELNVRSILHPSPASPLANRGWLQAAREQLEELGHPWPDPCA